MADVAISALINKTVDIAANFIVNEGSRLYWLSEDITWLQRQLKHMQSYLEDAEAKKVANPKVANLLKDIRDLAHDVEDIFDIYLPEIESHRSLGSIERAAKILSYGHTCSRFAREIQKIKRRVEGIDDDRQIYGIEGTSGSTDKSTVDPRTTTIHYDEPIVVGFDKDIGELKVKMLSNEEEYGIVSIVGMPGLGKTTLAKKVFKFVKDHFDCSASVSISQDPNVRSLLQDIAKQVGLADKEREENIEANLYSFLQTKRYVLFLDDIWHTKTWDSLKVSFPSENGSKVIITSRDTGVGRYISGCESYLHQLQPFDFQTSWELFSKSITPSLGRTSQGLDNSELEDIGKEIVNRCGGLPLAIVVTVGMLRERRMSVMAWREVLKGIGLEAQDKCSKILALSYKDLPTAVKPCFLYLGLFPEDHEMKASQLIRMWLAEDFIQGIGELEPEDVGENYLNILDARNLVQVVSRKDYDGRIKRFRIHDLLHNLCVNVGKEINFLHTTLDTLESSSSTRIRRLGVQNTLDFGELKIPSNDRKPKVRTLLLFEKEKQSPITHAKVIHRNAHLLMFRHKYYRRPKARLLFGKENSKSKPTSNKHVNEILPPFRFLHVLSLELDQGSIQNVLFDTKNLSRLKYLQIIREHTTELSPRIQNLKKLQTLDLRYLWNLNKVSSCIWEMKLLRHVIFGSMSNYMFRGNIKRHEVCLPNLQTLVGRPYIHLEPSWLNKFSNLRKLLLWGVDKQTLQVLSGSEPISKKLESLFFISGDNMSGTTFNLSQYNKLMKLTIDFRIQPIPQLHEFPPNVVKLTLLRIGLTEDPMEVLKKLAKLKILILGKNSFIQRRMDCSGVGSFPRLQVLQIESLPYLEELVDGRGIGGRARNSATQSQTGNHETLS